MANMYGQETRNLLCILQFYNITGIPSITQPLHTFATFVEDQSEQDLHLLDVLYFYLYYTRENKKNPSYTLTLLKMLFSPDTNRKKHLLDQVFFHHMIQTVDSDSANAA